MKKPIYIYLPKSTLPPKLQKELEGTHGTVLLDINGNTVVGIEVLDYAKITIGGTEIRL